jgi:hypothetical protein
MKSGSLATLRAMRRASSRAKSTSQDTATAVLAYGYALANSGTTRGRCTRTLAIATPSTASSQRREGSAADADHIWITHWHPLKGPKGNIIGVNVVAEDITERKRAAAGWLVAKRPCAKASRAFGSWRTTSVSLPGPPTRRAGSIGTTNDGTTTPARRLKKCRAGAGRKCTIPNMLIGLYIGSSKALKPEHLGRTHSRCVVATVAIAGSSRALCPSATRPAM